MIRTGRRGDIVAGIELALGSEEGIRISSSRVGGIEWN